MHLKKAQHTSTKAEQSNNIQFISKQIYDITGKMPTTASYHGYRAGPDHSRIDLTGLHIIGQHGKESPKEIPIVIRAVRGIKGSSYAGTDKKSRHTNATKGVRAGSVMEPSKKFRCDSRVMPNNYLHGTTKKEVLNERIVNVNDNGQVASFFFHSNQLKEKFQEHLIVFNILIARSSPLSPSTRIYKAIPFHEVYGPGACK